MQYIIFIAVAPIAAAMVVLVGVVAWRRRDTPPAVALLALSISTLAWLVFNTLELAAPSPQATLRWARITYVFVAASPVMWLIFALQYTDRSWWHRPVPLVLLAFIPITTAVAALTGGAQDLLWPDIQFVPAGGFLHLRPMTYGPWFAVHIAYSYTCVLSGAAVILIDYVRAAEIYRRQARWVAVGAVIPLIVNVSYIFELVPGLTKDYSPLAFSLAGAFFATSIFRHRLLDLRPVGRHELVQSLRDAVIVVDIDRQIVDANPSAKRVAGSDVRLIGQRLVDALPAAAALLSEAEDGRDVRDDVAIEADGEERWYEPRLTEITGHHGRPIGHLIVLHDVTERIETTRRLRRQERLAAIGQLAGGIAHDFNNLLGSIRLHAQLAERMVEEESGAAVANLHVIVEESQRAADLVEQILDFSRTQVVETRALDLGPFVEEVAGILERTIPGGISLTVEAPSERCLVDVDPTRIQQILLNLATNARDAMPDGGELRIAVERTRATANNGGTPSGAWARLIVSDTGTGMDEEVQRHLFEPFFTTKGPDRGTGLGLAQVYGIVKQHGGRIDVETAPGDGTTFTILLPLAEAVLGHDDAHGADGLLHGEGETLLVVDGTARYLEAIRDGLESLNYRVVTATSAREAVEAATAEPADLLLTDVTLPDLDADALLRELRGEAPGLKAIAITGLACKGNGKELLDAGFTDAVAKPFSMRRLASAVHDALNGDD